MFGLGLPEIVLILAVALIFVGPRRLPGIGASIGKALGEFRKSFATAQQDEPADSADGTGTPAPPDDPSTP